METGNYPSQDELDIRLKAEKVFGPNPTEPEIAQIKRETAAAQDDGQRYNIVRFFRKSGRRKIVKRNVTLSVAKLHCNDPRTSKAGVWFDGFEKIR